MKSKTRSLSRIKEKVFNTPLLMTESSLLPIVSYLENPVRTGNTENFEPSGIEKVIQDFDYSKSLNSYEEQELIYLQKEVGINPDTLVGLVDVSGTLVAKSGNIQGCVELTSYERIKATTKLQIMLGAKAIVYNIDSNGGEAYLAFSSARDLRKMADEAGVKTFSYIDGAACSAAYMIASSSHEIISNEDSDVGSIGVLIQLINNSKQLDKEGIQRTFITAGEHKVPFNEDGSFQPEFIERLEKGVSKTYDKFVKTVSDLRGISEEVIRNTEARVYGSDEALSLGLIDKIMEFEDFEKYVTSSLGRSSLNSQKIILLNTEDNMTKQATLSAEELQVELSTVQSQLEKAQEDNKKLTSDLQEAKEQLTHDADVRKQLSDLQEAHTKLLGEVAEKEHQSKLDARQAKLEAALGKDNEQVATLLASTESLEDAAFDVIAQSLSTSVEKKQEQLKEIGGEGQQSDTQLSLGELIAKKVTPRK